MASGSPTSINYIKLQEALDRAKRNQAKYEKKLEQFKQYEALNAKGKITYKNQKAKWSASMPAIKASFIDSLKEVLYEVNGYQLSCNFLTMKGFPCSESEIAQLTTLNVEVGSKLIDLDQKPSIVAAIAESDSDFKGIYNFQDLEGKDPQTHGKSFLADLEGYLKKVKNTQKATTTMAIVNNASNLAMGTSTNGMGVTTVVNMPATTGNGTVVNTGAGTGLGIVANTTTTTTGKGKKGKKGQAPTNGSTQGGRRKTRRLRR